MVFLSLCPLPYVLLSHKPCSHCQAEVTCVTATVVTGDELPGKCMTRGIKRLAFNQAYFNAGEKYSFFGAFYSAAIWLKGDFWFIHCFFFWVKPFWLNIKCVMFTPVT